ncbi:MAG: hypothetical protein BWY71_01329 [Planctomycetes bacterium ADurb.Bin412]|nr:MAG: hypothetical protein BWY71_01329 [Planctomycetes bacterium ADurb.Bin412]
MHHVQGDIGGMGIMNRVEEGDFPHFGIGRQDAAGHPVMGMDHRPAGIATADFLEIDIDNLPLELRGGLDRIAFIGAAVIFKFG